LRKRRKPKDDKRKHGMLLEAFKSMAKLAIDNGDDDTVGHAFARMMQTIKGVAGSGCTENWNGSSQSKIG
jgi:hypothetical protein